MRRFPITIDDQRRRRLRRPPRPSPSKTASITGNSARQAVAACCSNGAAVTFRGGAQSPATTQATSAPAAGIYMSGETAVPDGQVPGTAVSNNLATGDGGGIYAEAGAEVTVTSGAAVSNNDGSTSGGGVYLSDSGTTLTVSSGATILEKRRDGQRRRHPCASSATVYVNGGNITGNTAGLNGGGIYSSSGVVTIQGGAQVTGCDAGDTGNGSGIFVTGWSPRPWT
ncbi:MAG: hypothetical protein IPK19_20730 [Chloroflexi bacterium]|nr:hypothetical protein [Chloroflexota bacterium]